MKVEHEIRDPIHGFIHLSGDEMRIVNSAPFQRLRSIRQLALTNLVYPGATHSRFEHSLGVMELAGRIFDVVTREENLGHLTLAMRDRIAEGLAKKEDWRGTLRFAALCHDLGHLPFSHAGEAEGLLPSRWTTHESISVDLTISSAGLLGEWNKIYPSSPSAEAIAKIAVAPDPKVWAHLEVPAPKLSDWEGILSQIIVGDSFGADRMDYLLRDAHYVGVPNGKFDHLQLIEALRILPEPGMDKEDAHLFPDPDKKDTPLSLGLVRGGLHSAEALMMARYFMYQQVYNHRTRKIYDLHLQQFLKEWLPNGEFPASLQEHIALTDIEVWAGIREAARDRRARGHESARRIVERGHLKLAYWHRPKAGDFKDVREEARAAFEEDFDCGRIVSLWADKKKTDGFPVLDKDGRTRPSDSVSDFPEGGIEPSYGYVFADEKILPKVKEWFNKRKMTTSTKEA